MFDFTGTAWAAIFGEHDPSTVDPDELERCEDMGLTGFNSDDSDEEDLAEKGDRDSSESSEGEVEEKEEDDGGRMVGIIKEVLGLLAQRGTDLPSVIDAFLWGEKHCVSDLEIRGARTKFMNSEKLAGMLHRMWKPPGITQIRDQQRPSKAVLLNFVRLSWLDILSTELDNLSSFFQSEKGDDITEEALTSLSFDNLHSHIQKVAPNLFDTLHHLAYTKDQMKRNTHKDPTKRILMIIAILAYTRSHHNNLFQKALSVYLKFRGLSAKGFDSLHALGLTMSFKWTTESVGRMSEKAMEDVMSLIQHVLWFLSYDNLQLSFRVFSQRLENQGEFGNGCASTAYAKPSATPLPADANQRLQAQRAAGIKNPITEIEIADLAIAHSPAIRARKIYHVLQFLLQCPEFDLDSYEHRESNVLQPPAWLEPLPVGPEHIAKQKILGSVNIAETSYDDHVRLLKEWLTQLGIDTPEAEKKLGETQILGICGDQLTMERLRGLYRYRAGDSNSFDRLDWMVLAFGWFHLQMAFAQSLFKQYMGTNKGYGLRKCFSLLKRKGLQTASIKGPFHHHLEEAIYHICEAHILVEWKTVAKVGSLADLRSKSAVELKRIAEMIVDSHASTDALVHLGELGTEHRDEAKAQTVMWNRDSLEYVVLDEAIKHGDVGMMEAMLPTLLFRFIGGKNAKYTIEVLELLQGLHREWPKDVQDYVRHHCWVINFSGRRDGHKPIDQAQEQNNKDIKYLKKLHPAIPVIKSVSNHMEREFMTLTRGRKHTVPKKEADVNLLCGVFEESTYHIVTNGRVIKSDQDKAKDFQQLGQQAFVQGGTLENWHNNRSYGRSVQESWSDSEHGEDGSDDGNEEC
ncbi:hypothetical protein V5O48_012628 [Marasmius crinis-equi]|uniref:DUF6589 domain-containing protein n=1 Tax=Marasmius crinis-equi TaxID=585013 RepID=A0ABR3F2B9_9AGAR